MTREYQTKTSKPYAETKLVPKNYSGLRSSLTVCLKC